MSDAATPTLSAANLKLSIEELKSQHGPPPWHERIVINDRFVVTVICQAPGHQNDWHYHIVDETWSIYEGELSWTLERQAEPIHVKAGDWIIAPANTFHFIQVHGDTQSIRIAMSYAGEPHRHERENKPLAPAGARLS